MKKRAVKKCRGTNKRTVGVGCGEKKEIFRFGLCSDCYKDWLFNSENGKIYFSESTLKGSKKGKQEAKREERKKNKEVKRSVLTKSEIEKKLQTIVNSIVRIIDSGKGCISCEHGWEGNWTRQAHAGHRLSVGSNPALRFNFLNIFVQCSVCNNFKSSNEREYDKGLIKHYGQEMLETCRSLKSIQELKLTRDELEEAINKAKNLKKEILSGNDYSREELNKKLWN